MTFSPRQTGIPTLSVSTCTTFDNYLTSLILSFSVFIIKIMLLAREYYKLLIPTRTHPFLKMIREFLRVEITSYIFLYSTSLTVYSIHGVVHNKN